MIVCPLLVIGSGLQTFNFSHVGWIGASVKCVYRHTQDCEGCGCGVCVCFFSSNGSFEFI